jgi:hypothetical protein
MPVDEKWLSQPDTIERLAKWGNTSEAKIRRELKTFGNRLLHRARENGQTEVVVLPPTVTREQMGSDVEARPTIIISGRRSLNLHLVFCRPACDLAQRRITAVLEKSLRQDYAARHDRRDSTC